MGLLEWQTSGSPEMKGLFFLAIGALWITVALLLSGASFGIHWWKGALNPASVGMILRLALPVLFYGWTVPIALGFWLLWAKK